MTSLNPMGSHKDFQILSKLFHTFLKAAVHLLAYGKIGFYAMTFKTFPAKNFCRLVYLRRFLKLTYVSRTVTN